MQAPRLRLPPTARISPFLDHREHSQLLDWVLANPIRFAAAEIVDQGAMVVLPEVRLALTLRGVDDGLPWLRKRLQEAQQELIETLRLSVPPIESLEIELAAHGDGAHFAPHLDIPVGTGRAPRGSRPQRNDDRLLSAVYYFYKEPKRFSGGSLRIHPFGSEGKGETPDAGFIDIEPDQNSLIAFPSWATHEVREVRCPSGDFGDYRFAVNCWYCGNLAD